MTERQGRYRVKVDKNQPNIVEALRDVGASVFLTHRLGHGFPDLAVGCDGLTITGLLSEEATLKIVDYVQSLGCKTYNGANLLYEVKMPNEDLTPKETEFFDTWRGQVGIVETEEQAIGGLGK